MRSFVYLVKLVSVYACMYGLLNFACFPTVLWWREFGDKIDLSPFLQIRGALEILRFMVVAMYVFVAWLVLQLLVEKDTRMSSLLQVCVGFRIARREATLSELISLWPLAFCRGSKEMQGRRMLTA